MGIELCKRAAIPISSVMFKSAGRWTKESSCISFVMKAIGSSDRLSNGPVDLLEAPPHSNKKRISRSKL